MEVIAVYWWILYLQDQDDILDGFTSSSLQPTLQGYTHKGLW